MNTFLTHAALVAVQILFASFPVAGKDALEGIDPMALAAWRVVAAGITLGALAAVRYGRRFLPEGRRELLHLAGLALVGVVINQVLFINGLKKSTAGDASLLMAVIPMATYAVAVLVRQERLVGARLLGLALGTAATAWFVLSRPGEGVRVTGNVYILLNALSYSLYLVAARPLLARRPALVVVAWIFLLSIPPVAAMAADVPWLPSTASSASRRALLWIIVGPTILSYALNALALGRVRASTAAVYIYLQPLAGAWFAATFGDEQLGVRELVFGIAAALGIHLVTRKRSSRRPAAAPAPPMPERPLGERRP